MSGIFLNEDCNHFLYSRYKADIKVTEAVLRNFISQYANTQVTDIALNPNGMTSYGSSKVRETVLDKFLRYKEQGKVDESNAYCQILCNLAEQGLDMYSIWIDQCRKDGITPWISIRMNDCHCNNLDDHILLSEFFREKKHLRRVTHRSYAGYFDNCLDYARQEVRDHYLDYICECLENYDLDGLELDWQREVFCFKLGEEYKGIAILNDFMRAVKQKVNEAAARKGHPIKIGVRVAHSPIVSLKLGFDVMTWVSEKLVDLVVPTARWETTDNDMSIDFWKRIFDGTSIELAAGIELALRPHQTALHRSQTLETTAGNAVVNFSNGADKTYLFNYMDIPSSCDEESPDEPTPCSARNYSLLLNKFGSLETLLEMSRRHIVSYHDIEAPGIAYKSILPLEIYQPNHYVPVRIETGLVPAEKNITLIIAAKPLNADGILSEADFDVYLNSCDVEYLGPVTPPFAYSDSQHYAFAVKNKEDFTYASVAEFSTNATAYVIDHIELRVD